MEGWEEGGGGGILLSNVSPFVMLEGSTKRKKYQKKWGVFHDKTVTSGTKRVANQFLLKTNVWPEADSITNVNYMITSMIPQQITTILFDLLQLFVIISKTYVMCIHVYEGS